MIKKLAEIVTSLVQKEPVIHYYLMPRDFLDVFDNSFASNAHNLAMSVWSEGEKDKEVFIRRLAVQSAAYNALESSLSVSGDLPAEIDIDLLLTKSNYKINLEVAKRFSEDFYLADWTVLLSDSVREDEKWAAKLLASELTLFEFVRADKNGLLSQELLAAFKSSDLAVDSFRTFGEVMNVEDEQRLIYEFITFYTRYSLGMKDIGFEDIVLFVFLQDFSEGTDFFKKGLYDRLKERSMKRTNKIDIKGIDYFPGITPQERRYNNTEQPFSEYYRYVQQMASAEPFIAVLREIEQIYKLRYTDAHERAVTKLAYYFFRNCAEPSQAELMLKGNPLEIGQKVHNYRPVR